MKLLIKRAYDKAEEGDGTRVLVDRLWPRGVTKAKAKIDIWAKEIAPTKELREWFHADPEKRYASFKKKYEKELSENPTAKIFKAFLKKIKTVTLVTGAKDTNHSHVPVVLAFLKKR